jgi:multiple sugar transport system substrate-binding protein
VRPTTRFAVFAAASALLLTACGNAQTAAPVAEPAPIEQCNPNGVTISVAFRSQGEQAALLAKSAAEAEYPGLTVQLDQSTATNYDELTQQVVADLAVGKERDVVMVGMNQVRFFVDKYQPFPIHTEALKPSYDKRFLEVGAVDGKPYVAPFQVSLPVLYVNTDLATKAGVPALPKTTSELLDAARKVKATGASPVALPRDQIADWVAQAYIQSAGATFVNPDGTAGFDNALGRKGLSIYSDLAAQQLMDPVAYEDAEKTFTQGKLAYLVSSPAYAAKIQKTVGGAFGWTISDMPVPDGGRPVLPAGGNGWMVLSKDRCKAAFANEVISAMLDPEVIAESARSFSYIPVDHQAAQQLTADPAANTQLGYAWKFTGTLTPWGGWHGDSGPKVNQFFTDMVQELTNGRPLEDVLPATIRKINSAAGR